MVIGELASDPSFGHEPSSDEMAANARLIASAPDLLAALEGLADDYAKLFEAYQKSTGEKAFGWGMFPVEIAKEAIAKARGE